LRKDEDQKNITGWEPGAILQEIGVLFLILGLVWTASLVFGPSGWTIYYDFSYYVDRGQVAFLLFWNGIVLVSIVLGIASSRSRSGRRQNREEKLVKP
jgi:hypothetical protein